MGFCLKTGLFWLRDSISDVFCEFNEAKTTKMTQMIDGPGEEIASIPFQNSSGSINYSRYVLELSAMVLTRL